MRPVPACIRLLFAYNGSVMFDPNAGMPRPNRTLIYLGACIVAGLRLARERQVNVRVIPTGHAIEESIDLAHEIFNRVFRRVPEKMEKIGGG
ncbi:MAG: hypothetical protein WBV33_03080 [Terracidiphilus sp.]